MAQIITGPSPAFAPQPQPDLMQRTAELMQMRQQMQEAPMRAQLMQQQVQQGQMDNQIKQTQLKDQQAMTASMQQWDGKDINALVPLVVKNGGSAEAVMGLKKHALDQQAKFSEIAKNDATTGESNMKAMLNKSDMLGGALNALSQVPDEQLQQSIMQTAQGLAQNGILDQQHMQQAAQIAQIGDPAKMRAALDVFQKSNTAASQQMKTALEKAQTDQANARANEANVNATLAPAKLANQQANDATMRKQGAQRIGIEAARLNFERQKSGIDSTGSANNLAEAIAQGHITPDRMGYLLSRNPGLMEGVLKVDPSFDSSKAQAYPNVYKDFTSGKTSVALNSGATALGHLQELSAMNTNASHIPGTPDYNAYQNKADTVASELAKFYGDATIPAIASIKKTLTSTLPGNRQAAIKTQAQSMGDKLDSFQQQWENAAPSKAYQAPMPGISGKAKAARESLAGTKSEASSGGTVLMRAPNGQTRAVPADQVDHYLKLGATKAQ